jgi:hypothetical protein
MKTAAETDSSPRMGIVPAAAEKGVNPATRPFVG